MTNRRHITCSSFPAIVSIKSGGHGEPCQLVPAQDGNVTSSSVLECIEILLNPPGVCLDLGGLGGVREMEWRNELDYVIMLLLPFHVTLQAH